MNFLGRLVQANSGTSMSRTLMAVLVLTTCTCLVIAVWRYGFGIPMATAICGLGTTLAGVWGIGKWKQGDEHHEEEHR